MSFLWLLGKKNTLECAEVRLYLCRRQTADDIEIDSIWWLDKKGF
jgi:hypothetical protein